MDIRKLALADRLPDGQALNSESVAGGRARRGSTLLQMALVTPVLIVLAFGVAEYGHYFWVKSCMQNVASIGARAAVESTATNTTVTSAISSAMQSYGLQSSGYAVSVTPANLTGLPTGQQVSVTVSCGWGTVGLHVLPAGMGGIPDTKQVTSTVVMNRE